MKKKSSKYLDALFRKALKEGTENTGSMEQDWTVMERRLDQQERRRRIFFWIRSAGGIAIVILMVAIFWPSTDSKQLFDQTTIEKSIENKNDQAKENREKDQLTTKDIDINEANIPDKPEETSGSKPDIAEPPVAVNERSNPPDELQTRIDRGDIVQRQQRFNTGNKNLETHDQPSVPDLSGNLNAKGQIRKPSEKPSLESASINPSAKRPVETISEDSSEKSTRKDISGVEVKDKFPKEWQSEKEAATIQEKENIATAGKQLKLKQTGGFYYGLLAGPDLSMIKSQSVKGVGYNIGLLAGYRFNKHWSVETGLSWAKKKYYTDGKYFDKSNAGMPSSLNLISLEGGCEMLIVPVSIRYDFNIGQQSFFTSAGLNSYFMKKESYDYLAGSPGWSYQGFKSYKNSGNHPFSNLQFTAGYNYPLWSATKLRIEPYVNIPLKKVSIGKMPLTSAGVYLGIVRELISRPASKGSK